MIIGNILLDHFLAPTGILLSPVITAGAIVIILLNNRAFNSILIQATIAFLLIGINDIGIKLYGGGIHDSEGQGFVNLFYIIDLIPCFFVLCIYVVKKTDASILQKIISISLFISLAVLHLNYFDWLGLGKSYI